MEQKPDFPSELRLDLASNNWVIIAKGRGKKPEAYKKIQQLSVPPSECPFCNIDSQRKPLEVIINGKVIENPSVIPDDWTTIVIPNLFPALVPGETIEEHTEGNLYQRISAVGHCELVVTKEHGKFLADFTVDQIKEIIMAYQARYLALKPKKYVNYISIFHNNGPAAGASQPHNHCQIITTPLVDNDLTRALENAAKYYNTNNRCLYCDLNDYEMQKRERIVYENEGFLITCPFASKSAFEMIISPKEHSPYFEQITPRQIELLADAFKIATKVLREGIGDPDYNFYLHTSPCIEGNEYPFYHWHFTFLPKMSVEGGFELGTSMEISTIEPEKACEFLKKFV